MADLNIYDLALRERNYLRKPQLRYTHSKTRSTTPVTTPTLNQSLRAGRIEKPLSQGGSPHYTDRRRHTTTARSRPVFNFENSIRSGPGRQSSTMRNQHTINGRKRPLSWHPGSSIAVETPLQDMSLQACNNDGVASPNYDGHSSKFSATSNSGHATTVWPYMAPFTTSFYQQDQTQRVPTFPLLSQDSSYDPAGGCSIRGPDVFPFPFSGHQLFPSQGYDFPPSFPGRAIQYPTMTGDPSIAGNMQSYMNAGVFDSQPSPPQSVPRIHTQNFGDHNSEETWVDDDRDSPITPDESDVLIGMGLYDRPSESSYLFSSLNDSQCYSRLSETPASFGKGLKLEEEWQPPPASVDEDDDEDEDEELEEEENDKDEADLKAEEPDGDGDADTDDTYSYDQVYSYAVSPANFPVQTTQTLFTPCGLNNYNDMTLVSDAGEHFYPYGTYVLPATTNLFDYHYPSYYSS